MYLSSKHKIYYLITHHLIFFYIYSLLNKFSCNSWVLEGVGEKNTRIKTLLLLWCVMLLLLLLLAAVKAQMEPFQLSLVRRTSACATYAWFWFSHKSGAMCCMSLWFKFDNRKIIDMSRYDLFKVPLKMALWATLVFCRKSKVLEDIYCFITVGMP